MEAIPTFEGEQSNPQADLTYSQPTLNSSIPQDQTLIYESFSSYKFEEDSEFQAGLASILGHPDTLPTEAESEAKADLVLQAQCFFYSRKFNTPAIDPLAYRAWKQASEQQINKSSTSTSHEPSKINNTNEPPPPPSTSTSTSTTQIQQQAQSQAQQARARASSTVTPATQPPPYPISFAAIVELITNDQPIPGIEQIPDTVLEHGSSKRDRATRRRKPWEKDVDESSSNNNNGNNHTISTDTSAAIATSTVPISVSDTYTNKDPEAVNMLSSMMNNLDNNGRNSTTVPEPDFDPSDPLSIAQSQLEHMDRVRRTGVGVMHILSPEAVPDSGLVAKD